MVGQWVVCVTLRWNKIWDFSELEGRIVVDVVWGENETKGWCPGAWMPVKAADDDGDGGGAPRVPAPDSQGPPQHVVTQRRIGLGSD